MSYEHRERMQFHADLQRIEKQPPRDRQEARAEFAKALKDDPELVAERIGWLLAGNYGKGSYDAAREVLKSRMNKPAWLTTTIAALEWSCPAKFAIEAWKKLSTKEKDHLNALIAAEVRHMDAE